MKNKITLIHSDQVRTNSDKYRTKFTVGTVEGYCHNIPNALERAVNNRHELAWINASGSCITSDYEGKSEDLRKERDAYENAIVLEQGDRVIVEGREYTVKILPNHENYSDGIKLVPFSNHPYIQ